ncbi:MAG: hypothetical protein AB1430_02925 [Pseudomonadota bacterium]
MTVYTLGDLHGVLGIAPSPQARLRQLVGLLLPQMIEQGPPLRRSAGWHVAEIRTAVEHGRADVFFDDYGRPAGSLLWKWLDDAGEAAVLAGAEVTETQAAAQGSAWVAHFHARHVGLRHVLRCVQPAIAARAEEIAYARVRNRRRTAKQVRVPQLRAARRACSQPSFLGRDAGRQLRAEAIALLSEAQRLGDWLLLATGNQVFARWAPSDLLAALLMPLRLGNFVEVPGPDDTLHAFLAYGLLTPDGLERLARQGPMALSPACFSEGDVMAALCAGAAEDASVEAELALRVARRHAGQRRMLRGAGIAALDRLDRDSAAHQA